MVTGTIRFYLASGSARLGRSGSLILQRMKPSLHLAGLDRCKEKLRMITYQKTNAADFTQEAIKVRYTAKTQISGGRRADVFATVSPENEHIVRWLGASASIIILFPR
jgi:hypothetical protein